MDVLSRTAVATGVAAAIGAVLVAYLTTLSPQLALTVTLLTLAYGLYVADRQAAVLLMWGTWLLAPFVRRLLGLTGYVDVDPLSVAPALITALVATLDLTRGTVSRRTRRVTGLVVAGWAIGLPVGLAVGPTSAIYNFVVYLTAAGGYVIGERESAAGTAGLTLVRTLAVSAPLLAAYGVLQYLLPLSSWDRAWVASTDIPTIGGPEPGKVRVFATLNSPGVLAPLLAVALLWLLLRRRTGIGTAVTAAVIVWGLALTYVRSAWVALAAALLVVLVTGGRPAVARVVLPAVAGVLVVLALAPSNQTAAAVSERFSTLGSLGTDTSAQARSSTWSTVMPQAVSAPLGHGLGTAGEGSKLSGGSPLRAADNGYLALVYQAGPIGALLVLAGLVLAVAEAARRAWRHRDAVDEGPVVLGTVVLMLVFLASGDQFYGVIGVTLWYVLGAAGGALWRRGAPQEAPTG